MDNPSAVFTEDNNAFCFQLIEDLRSGGDPDSRLAAEAIQAITSIYSYNGQMPHESGVPLLFDIYQGAYKPQT